MFQAYMRTMMKNKPWEEFDFGPDGEFEAVEQKKSSRQRKRKWREIEDIKEKQRLKRELSSYESYSF